MTLAAAFFGGINVAADTVGKQALDAQLVNTPVDVQLRDFSVDGEESKHRVRLKQIRAGIQDELQRQGVVG